MADRVQLVLETNRPYAGSLVDLLSYSHTTVAVATADAYREIQD
jgi:hypothetical protein